MYNDYQNSKDGYYSAEFQLNQSKIMYQFRLRKSMTEPMFAVVKEGSEALKNIKEGDVIEMYYHFLDKTIPSEQRQTLIKYISKDSTVGFKDHYVIGLSFDLDSERHVA